MSSSPGSGRGALRRLTTHSSRPSSSTLTSSGCTPCAQPAELQKQRDDGGGGHELLYKVAV